MPVLGINITKVEMEKQGGIASKVEINLSPKIEEVRLGEIKTPSGKVNGIEVLFTYQIGYRPDIARALISGMVFYLPPQKEKIDEILDNWERDKKVPPEMFAEIVNFITNEVTPMIMLISKEMRIPYPIPVPRVSIKQP
ncbi:hypothetical protein K1720_10165 [Thermococcus argininiproducens]|uniref:Uncharacterized protein n=1 Tax=Thermococcus argininiproducens TaxID=2866384 RepID=A0A9E7M9X9_9EURY|nr:hypothetical protein [Thermococcus argininiproducens]USG99833.1 hypothetical protein K1720_10165 [Thermococcus argininiproducens]